MMPKGFDTNERVKQACYTLKKDINIYSLTRYFKENCPKRVPSINTLMNILKGADYLIPDGDYAMQRVTGDKGKVKNYRIKPQVKYTPDGLPITQVQYEHSRDNNSIVGGIDDSK
jgi:hypothetical protein